VSVTRYGFDYRGDSVPKKNGEWVKADDAGVLETANAFLRAENQRLRDALVKFIKDHHAQVGICRHGCPACEAEAALQGAK
jgi:hypothetical protein